jgi:cytochrome c
MALKTIRLCRSQVSLIINNPLVGIAVEFKMIEKLFVFALLALSLISGSVQANQMLAMQSGCLGCHKTDAKLVGPAFKDIAAKYADDPAEIEQLTNKVKSGSTPGEPLIWGTVAMPPNQAPPERIRQVIEWIMTLK